MGALMSHGATTSAEYQQTWRHTFFAARFLIFHITPIPLVWGRRAHFCLWWPLRAYGNKSHERVNEVAAIAKVAHFSNRLNLWHSLSLNLIRPCRAVAAEGS